MAQRGKWQDQYRVGQAVETVLHFQDGPRWVSGRVQRKTRTGLPIVMVDGSTIIAVDRKVDIRLTRQP